MIQETKSITQQQLITMLMAITKPTFINLVMETEVRMNKTNNPYYKLITKYSSRNYSIGNDYDKRVNNNYVKEGMEATFETEAAKGKHHISKCVLVDDKTESVLYVMLEIYDEVKPVNMYYFNGQEIDKDVFSKYMPAVHESTKQECERKVKVITPKISSIKAISLNGIRYIVK